MSEQSHSVHVDGLVLEGLLDVPAAPSGGVVLCHPHPLYGGDMDNPVVVRAAEVCREANLATLRFNFRGVGRSGGRHGSGLGEQDDLLAALDALAGELRPLPLGIVGYSFGATITARCASRTERMVAMTLIAPPLRLFDFNGLGTLRPRPLLLLAGTRDPYCPIEEFQALARHVPWAGTSVIDDADHFFFGKLFPLGTAVAAWALALAQADTRDAGGHGGAR